MDGVVETTLRYDEGLIAQCLEDIRRQRLGWLRWFEINNIAPFVVNYEDLLADGAGVIRGVVELLGVQNDEPEEVRPPLVARQGDEVNIAWALRFRRDHDLPPTASLG
jgi:LPS sulfotransferase NodH